MREYLAFSLRSVALLLLAAGTAQANDLIVNGRFEDPDGKGGVVGWTGDGGRLDAGSGRSMTGSLLFRSSERVERLAVEQHPAFEGGRRYRITCWMHTEKIAGNGGARLQVEAFDAAGTRVAFAQTREVRDTLGRYIDLDLPIEFPVSAKRYTLRLQLSNCSGAVWFDDVAAVPVLVTETLGEFISSAYRNVALDGDVTFTAVILADGRTCEERGFRGLFRLPDGRGGVSETEAPVRDGAVRLTTSVAKLPFGRHPVQFVLMDRDGKEIGRRELLFDRVRRLPSKGVWFDSQHRTLVDGKPFFPLGWYMSSVETWSIADMRKGPFNCVMPYQRPDRAQMDLCQTNGIKVLYSIKEVFHGYHWCPDAIKSVSDETVWLAARVAEVGNHPALLGWYCCDELDAAEWGERLRGRKALMNRLDPRHPVWTVQYQVQQDGEYRAYVGTYDVAGTDPYPINWKDVRENAAMPSEWTRRTRNDSFASCPIWQVPQFFDGGAFNASRSARSRPPTEQELSCFSWQCIAEGANGLVYYAYHPLVRMKEKDPFDVKWGEACRVGGEIAEKFDLLLSDDVTHLVKSSPEDVRVRAWRGPNGPVALAVNATYEARQVSFAFEGRPYSVKLQPLGHAFVPCGRKTKTEEK